jgi:hypothetical protein
METGVETLPRQQLLVRPALRDDAVAQHENHVGVANRRQPMGDGDRCPACHQPRQALEDQLFGFRIERRRRLVEQEDRGVANDRTRDRDSLPLAAR